MRATTTQLPTPASLTDTARISSIAIDHFMPPTNCGSVISRRWSGRAVLRRAPSLRGILRGRLSYRTLTLVTDEPGGMREVRVTIPAGTALPDRLLRLLIADVFPLAVRALGI